MRNSEDRYRWSARHPDALAVFIAALAVSALIVVIFVVTSHKDRFPHLRDAYKYSNVVMPAPPRRLPG